MIKLSLALLVIGYSSVQAQTLNLDASAVDQETYEISNKMACTTYELGEAINRGERVVPKYIFHFGQAQYMAQNVEARTIPQKAWDEFIMGGRTRFRLDGIRRGLYGTAGIDTNNFGGGGYDAIIQIDIKEECRNPERVITFFDIHKSARFKQWFQQTPAEFRARTFTTPDQFASVCMPNGANYVDYSGRMPSPSCNEVLELYMFETKVAIVQDHAISKAFYIRERDCIESIKGTSAEILEIAAKPTIWTSKCGEGGLGAFLQMIQAALENLERDSRVDTSTLEKLRTKLVRLNTRSNAPNALTNIIDAGSRCKLAGKRPDWRARFSTEMLCR